MAVVATDNFDRANGTLGANWTTNLGAFLIDSNHCVSNQIEECGAHWNADSFGNDQYAQAVFSESSSGPYAGVSVRCAASAATFYEYYVSNASAYLSRLNSGSWTQMGATGDAVSDGATVRLEANGTIITPMLNGSTDASIGAQTNSSISSGYAGVSGYADGATAWVDNWEGGNLGGTGGSVTATVGTSTASGVAPTLSGAAAITSAIGTSTAAGVSPTVSVSASVTGTVATATGAGVAPSLSYGQTVTGAVTTATAAGVASAVTVAQSVTATVATSTGSGIAPSLSYGQTTTATVATATGAGLAPAITVAQAVTSAVATSTAAGIAPEVTATAGAQLAYAIADSYVGNWVGEGGETTDLYTHIDETSASDSDYVKSEESPASSPFVVQLDSLTDPADHTNHVLSYRYLKSATGGGSINLTVQLRQNYTNEGSPGDLIAQWQHNDIDAVTQNDGTLTADEAGSISAYSALFVRFVADLV